jgi:hypothetical protein
MPMPVEPMYYATPMGSSRPGGLAGMAIVSILIGSFSILLSIFGLLIAPTARALTAVPAPATPGGGAAVYSGPTGFEDDESEEAPITIPDRMTPPQRQVIAAALQRRQGFSPRRAHMLDLLLAKGGDEIFSFDAAGMTPQNVIGAVSNAGEFQTTGDRPGNTFFVFETGRLELADDHAVFAPTHGDAIRVYESADAPKAAAPATTAPMLFMPPPPPPPPPGWMMGYGIAVLGNVLAAVWLVICAVLVLRRSPLGRRCHLIYAAAKILTSIALALTIAELFNPTAGLVVGLVGIVYPLIVLVVFNTPGVRTYYAPAVTT